MKTSELTGAALDWAVARIKNPDWWDDGYMDGDPMAALDMDDGTSYSPSTDWSQGGPIIGKEGITLRCGLHGWDAELPEFGVLMHGANALEAAMRCYVASKLGENVDIPQELTA